MERFIIVILALISSTSFSSTLSIVDEPLAAALQPIIRTLNINTDECRRVWRGGMCVVREENDEIFIGKNRVVEKNFHYKVGTSEAVDVKFQANHKGYQIVAYGGSFLVLQCGAM